MEWVWRRKGAGEYRLKFWLQTGAKRWATGRNVKEEWGCLVKMGTSWANNRSCLGSGPILCPRLLAPVLGTPPHPATTPSTTCGGFPPSQGGRAQAQTFGLRRPSLPPCAPPRPAQGACAPPLKSRLSKAREWGPSALRSRHSPGGVGEAVGVSQTATHTHLPSHGWNKHVALETATAGAGARSLECFSKSADNNALAFEDSRQGENHTRFLPFMSLGAARRTPLRMRRLPVWHAALPLGKCSFHFTHCSRLNWTLFYQTRVLVCFQYPLPFPKASIKQ